MLKQKSAIEVGGEKPWVLFYWLNEWYLHFDERSLDIPKPFEPPSPFTINNIPVVPRRKWCDPPPKTEPIRIPTPVKYVMCSYTRRSPCFAVEACSKELLALYGKQTKFRDNPDITYNFMIGGDGTVYEGRGWGIVPSLPKRFRAIEKNCVYIAMIGTFQFRPPSDIMRKTQKLLIKYGMDNNFIEKKILQFTT